MDKQDIRLVDMALYLADQAARTEIWKVREQWFREGAVTNIAINLNDALQKLAKAGLRVDFNDEVPEGDVTDHVARYRNAACHFGSASRRLENGVLSAFNIIAGAGAGMQIGDLVVDSPHADDVAYFYGSIRLYHVRHIQRAITVAKQHLPGLAEHAGVRMLLTTDR